MAGTPTQSMDSRRDGELLKSGTTVGRNASVRVGFVPLALEHVVLEGLSEIPVFLRTIAKGGKETEYHFTLYSTQATRFAEHHRARLKEAGVKFIYIGLHHQMKFRRQVESYLEKAMTDPAMAISARSELVYETSVELVDELLLEQGLRGKMPRLESIAKAVTTLVMNDASSFSHLFAASQHDFYTATHMVNVGTWMVPLAYACGIREMDQLNLMCVAGMLHDIGKIFVPEEVLNKPGKLTDEDWQQLRAHPALGGNHLKTFHEVPEVVLRVALEHHERMDGSGYPARLAGDAILLASRICAVVDCFDAMTAFRPFKDHTMSFGQALRELQEGAGPKYDKHVVDTWVGLMQRADADGVIPQRLQTDEKPSLGKRKHERFPLDCPALMQVMELSGEGQVERGRLPVTAHNLSRAGLGVLSRQPIAVTQYVRVHLLGTGTLANRVLEGQIVRARPFADGWHDLGMRFASLHSEYQTAENTTRMENLPQPTAGS